MRFLLIILLLLHCSARPPRTKLSLPGVVDLDYDIRLREFLVGTGEGVHSLGPSGRSRPLLTLPENRALHALYMHNLTGQLFLLVGSREEPREAPREGSPEESEPEIQTSELLAFSGGQTRSITLPPEMRAPLAITGHWNTLYLSDRNRPLIASVSGNRPPEILIENSHFLRNGLALGGIVFARGNYLLASQLSTGRLYRIPVGNPFNFRPVAVATDLPPAHKLLWTAGGELAVIGRDKILYLQSFDDWESGRVVQVDSGQIKSATLARQQLYLATSP
ncbi:MAG: hypothetical protein HS115_14350 [Spirochaetales bacterium]|nr:hypothetical protein [Spirochaetales bacterium]